MKASIFDRAALVAVPPAALSAYARNLGWEPAEAFGERSDVYSAQGMPEIVLPRTKLLGDYARVVSQLLEIFSEFTDMDSLSVYRDLVTADRDVIRVRSPGAHDDGSIPFDTGLDLLQGSREMLLAAASSLSNPQSLYRAGANRHATEHLQRMSLGQTEQGSFVVTILSPAISQPIQMTYLSEDRLDADPFARLVTRRVAQALAATRNATERTISGTDHAFSDAVQDGVSANMCEAIVQLIGPFSALDISFSWARTYPRNTARESVRFVSADAPVLEEAARAFRGREPMPDIQLFGFVRQLTRQEKEIDGAITICAPIEDSIQSVTAVLSQADYIRAIEAHRDKAAVIATGDLERVGQRWRLVNARIKSLIPNEEGPENSS